MASEWPEVYLSMCSSAPSRESTTFTAATRARNSLPQSSATAGTSFKLRSFFSIARERASAWSSTPALFSSAAIRGR